MEKNKSNFYPPYSSLNYAFQLWRGIQYLHRHNYLHKDIKPSNVFINKSQVMLGDFGLLNYPVKLTGSPLYMPKDIEHYNGNVDLFAFALILIELFFDNGSLALHLVRHSKLCWSRDKQLITILNDSLVDEDSPDFFKVNTLHSLFDINTIYQELIKAVRQALLMDEFQAANRDDINFSFEKVLQFPSKKFTTRPTLDLRSINPFFQDNRFVMNYVAELGTGGYRPDM